MRSIRPDRLKLPPLAWLAGGIFATVAGICLVLRSGFHVSEDRSGRHAAPRPSFASLWMTMSVLVVLAAIAVGSAYSMSKSKTMEVAAAVTHGDAEKAPTLLRRYGCAGCHMISSLNGADGKVGPALDDLRTRVYIGGVLRNTPDNLARWIADPQGISPHSAMPVTGISQEEARDVAAYLYSR